MFSRHFWLAYLFLEWRVYFRSWMNPFFIYCYPLLLLFIYGTQLGDFALEGLEHNPFNLIIPQIITTTLLVGALLSWGQRRAVEDRYGAYRSFRFTPLTRFQFDSAGALVNLLNVLLSTVVSIMIARFMHGTALPNWGLYFLYFTLSAGALYSITLLIVTILKGEEARRVFLFFAFFLCLFLSGATFPLSPFMRKIAVFLPPFHVIELFRSLWPPPSRLIDTVGQGVSTSLVLIATILLGTQLLRWIALRTICKTTETEMRV